MKYNQKHPCEFTITYAITSVTFLVYSISNISLGPWAFESGPKTPVVKIYASGYLFSKSFINGIEPPRPFV